MLALGAETYPGGDPAVFNMAVMGMRLAQRVNGVSKLHGEVSREMFAGLWPGFDAAEVPIGSITNGVHAPTWVAPRDPGAGRAGSRAPAAELPTTARPGTAVGGRPRRAICGDPRSCCAAGWSARPGARLRASWRQRGASEAELGWIARRARPGRADDRVRPPGALLQAADADAARPGAADARCCSTRERPVQLVIAGKAHPADDGGKGLIQQMVRFADDPAVRHRIVFLPDYDMAHGAGLWSRAATCG